MNIETCPEMCIQVINCSNQVRFFSSRWVLTRTYLIILYGKHTMYNTDCFQSHLSKLYTAVFKRMREKKDITFYDITCDNKFYDILFYYYVPI